MMEKALRQNQKRLQLTDQQFMAHMMFNPIDSKVQ
jgi:hypothetical protein